MCTEFFHHPFHGRIRVHADTRGEKNTVHEFAPHELHENRRKLGRFEADPMYGVFIDAQSAVRAMILADVGLEDLQAKGGDNATELHWVRNVIFKNNL